MNDYGFATLDQQGNNAINAKNPIFGFDMAHTPRPFKTFHITDTRVNPFDTETVAIPNPTPVDSWGWSENNKSGKNRVLIKRVKHGYNFRPVGYATITGNWNVEKRVQIQQTQYAGNFGGNYTKTLIKQNPYDRDMPFTPNQFNQAYVVQTSQFLGAPYTMLDKTDFSGTIFEYQYITDVLTLIPWGDQRGEYAAQHPIQVEIDDEYINIYYEYAWSDVIRRAKFTYSGQTTHDLQERVKIVTQYIGSTYDVTVYLCPYPIEELIGNG